MNITLKEVPQHLHLRLRERADHHGRSLNKEILFILEKTVNPVRIPPQDLYLQLRRHHEDLPLVVKEEELHDLIHTGRE